MLLPLRTFERMYVRSVATILNYFYTIMIIGTLWNPSILIDVKPDNILKQTF